MTLHFLMERRDVVDAVRFQLRKKMWFFALILLVIVAFDVFDVISSIHAGILWSDALARNAIGLIVPILVIFLVYWLSPMLAARKMIIRPVTWDLDSERVRLTSDVATAELRWSAFVKFVENSKTMLLYVQKGQAHVLPKRELSAAQQDELRDLIRAHVPSK